VAKKWNLKTRLGQYLVLQGLVKLRDVNRCMREQKRLRENGERCRMGQLLVKEQLITPEQLRGALAAIGALMGYCPRCRARQKIASYQSGAEEHCARCRAVLVYEDVSGPPPPEKPRLPVPDTHGKDTTVTKDPAKDPLINRIIGGCQILERVARGGMGVVYKAKQLNLGRTVAVKILAKDLANDALFVRRFMHEARAAAELNHGNIIHINDVGQFEGIFYYTMEYVDGATLSEILKQGKRLDALGTAQIALQVCHALRHAHQKHIIHRDIKPENIMLTNEGVVKLADLGLAKWTGDADMGLTQTGAVMGTPYYMAPEQAKDFSKVDERSDIYSLGVTLYRVLTGRVPFEGRTALEVMVKAASGLKRAIREARPDVPEEFEAVIHRMMDPDPDRRYQNVQDVINALGKVLQQLSVECES
jgi:hypothetical protein